MIQPKKVLKSTILVLSLCLAYPQAVRPLQRNRMMEPGPGIQGGGMAPILSSPAAGIPVDPTLAIAGTILPAAMAGSAALGMGIAPAGVPLVGNPMLGAVQMNPILNAGVGIMPSPLGLAGASAPLLPAQSLMGVGGVMSSPGLGITPSLGQSPTMGLASPAIATMGIQGASLPMAGLPGLGTGILNPMMGMALFSMGLANPLAGMIGPLMNIMNASIGIPRIMPGISQPMMGMTNPMAGIVNPVMGMMNPIMSMPRTMPFMQQPMMDMTHPSMGMYPSMPGMTHPMMGMPNPMAGMPQPLLSAPLIFALPLVPIPSTTPSSPTTTVRTADVVLIPFSGDSCIFCHSDLARITALGFPEFYFDLATVQAETGMPATCVDCHLGNPADFTVDGAHIGVLGLLVMRGRYRDIVRRKDIAPLEYDLVSSIQSIRASNTADPRTRLRIQSPFHMLLWHDRNLSTASWNPSLSMQTCGRCHAANVTEYSTTEMGQVLTMSQYIPWLTPPAGLGTLLKVAPQSCGLWTARTTPPNNDAFTDENRLLYNSTSTRIATQFADPLFPETSADPLTRLQALANQKNCNKCHPGCLDCHYAPFEENIPAAMGPGVKPAGTHTFAGRPLIMNCMSIGRGQFCHAGAIERRRGDGFVKGGFAHVPPAALQTPETQTYLATPDIHYNGDLLPANATCVDCHGPLAMGAGPPGIHGDMNRNPEPARCAVCHPAVVAAWSAGTHSNLTCGACHATRGVGYAFNLWAPGSRFGITPNPLDRHERYAVNAMKPVLLLDENGRWAPYHVVPHIATHIDPLYLVVGNYLSPRILWRNQPDIGIIRQHPSKDGVAVTGSYNGNIFGRDEGQVMVFLNIDKIAHSITSMASSLPPRTCIECHTPTGTQQIPVSFAWNGDPTLVYQGLISGTFDIVADGLGLRIENLNGDSAALIPMVGKWSVPGSYVIPPATGPAVGHPAGVL